MAAVKSKNTKPEVALRQALFQAGVRGWRVHYGGAEGTPDIAWPRLKIAVFVDGAFWHGHPSRHKPGRSGSYWDRKISTNVGRDRRVDANLDAAGWLVIRVWDFEIKRDLPEVLEHILQSLRSRLPRDSETEWQRLLHKARGDQPKTA